MTRSLPVPTDRELIEATREGIRSARASVDAVTRRELETRGIVRACAGLSPLGSVSAVPVGLAKDPSSPRERRLAVENASESVRELAFACGDYRQRRAGGITKARSKQRAPGKHAAANGSFPTLPQGTLPQPVAILVQRDALALAYALPHGTPGRRARIRLERSRLDKIRSGVTPD